MLTERLRQSFALLCCLTALSWLAIPSPAAAEAEPFARSVQAAATHEIRGLVLSTRTMELSPGNPHLVSTIEVDRSMRGHTDAYVAVEVSGGRLDDQIAITSDMPALQPGDVVELALVHAPIDEAAPMLDGVTEATEAYSIVGGMSGTRWLSGDPTDQRAAFHSGDETYRYRNNDGNGPLAWIGFRPVPGYAINAANSGPSHGAARNALRAAIDTWMAESGSDVEFSYLGTTFETGTVRNNFNSISWVSTPNPADIWPARTTTYLHGTTQIVEFDVEFNLDYAWSTYTAGTAGAYDIESAMLHEMGHALGLDDVEVTGQVMSDAGLAPGVVRRYLGLGDIIGIRGLYPGPGQLCGGKVITVELGFGQLPTEGDDVIRGTNFAERIDALGGDDTICALGGDDLVFSGPGNDVIYGGDGNDALRGAQGADTIHGEAGDDVLHGDRGDDTLYGGLGDDRIFGYADDDLIHGGDGDDRLHGNFGNDVMHGEAGNDRMWGYGDNDKLYGGPGVDLMAGNFGNDLLSGDADRDQLFGGDGKDNLYGGDGNDTVAGNSGDDMLYGHAGDDVLDGGINHDTCHGHGGTDSATRCEVVLDVP